LLRRIVGIPPANFALDRAENISPCRSERVTSDGITASGAASLNSAATIALADDLVSNFASMAGAGNVSRAVDRAGHILCRPILGGLHHQYCRI
jgi:hypothetical protein